ncbi:MAG: cell division protein FtsX [Balneolaceae bacterium]
MSISYVIREGFAGIKRTRLAAFTSMFSLFIAVFLIGVLARVGYNAYEVSNLLRNQIEVEVFLYDLDDRSTRDLHSRIAALNGVSEIVYISKDSASVIFKDDFGFGGEAMADLNFLPASFRITIAENTEIEQIESLVSEIESFHGVDDVKFNIALLQVLEARMETLAIVGSSIGLLILITAMILVFNTIRLTIYAKRDLIRAMKLVGATNTFIRRPFLMEGIIQGISAGLIASGIIYALFEWLVPAYVPQLGILAWPFGRWYFLIGGIILLAVLLGWTGSRWAARKFIRETTVYSDNK